MLGGPVLDGETQAKVVMVEAAAASDAQTVVNAESLSSLKGRDGSWIVAAKTKQYHWRLRTWEDECQ